MAMFLKRSNAFAWVLLLLASFFWIFGQEIITGLGPQGDYETTASYTEVTSNSQETSGGGTFPTTETWNPTTQITSPTTETWEQPTQEPVPDQTGSKFWGFVLCFLGLALTAAGVFLLRQKTPLLGPDGIGLLMVVWAALYGWIRDLYPIEYSISALSYLPAVAWLVIDFSVLIALRELWGWILGKCSLSWCLSRRLAGRCKAPQLSLLIYTFWIVASVAGMGGAWLLREGFYEDSAPLFWGGALNGAFALLCLWRYGADLGHFQKQLENYRKGQPISVGKGAFSETEGKLVDIQTRHQQAIQKAVTSERFKVELIANVSHDLRTPLTSILGYGELLEKENLSPEGREQLDRLNRKAGYMSELVESLFQLTKVSSGAEESQLSEIDLVRLLEQTIGLFDDQLGKAGLTVRRNYGADAIPLVTDGARMHQVFANLLGNAIKYALPGTRIFLEVKETNSGYWVRMMNTASYEMDFQPEEIVQRFARGDKARSTRGSGLGLAIAKTYTESVGGTFRVAVDGDQFSAIVELPKPERDL
ncbi:MAG TPA: HAMP domain-containing histidine kinase [Candidatus Faecousia excrementigallinarum]|uniref:histidine kinase n=1 Tax=Candidatus Faecousia excrementigallinarum TaxID=2840806 RepID=A0A9D1CMR9_9FIRM|nr:HAMP domain-containing histidine kinase [Candidatus Faecousia excrementigallinarum]